MTDNNALLVLTTAPDMEAAEKIADRILTDNLAACVNILGNMKSMYRWQGELIFGSEHQMFIKTTKAQYPHLERTITHIHPYELPEIIVVPVEGGLPEYLDWIQACAEH